MPASYSYVTWSKPTTSSAVFSGIGSLSSVKKRISLPLASSVKRIVFMSPRFSVPSSSHPAYFIAVT